MVIKKVLERLMANRHKDFDKLMASKFKNKEFAQAYIINLVNEESMSLEEALHETIVSMGLLAFADRAGVSIQYVSDFVAKRKKLSTDTIIKYLYKVFYLNVTMNFEVAEKKFT